MSKPSKDVKFIIYQVLYIFVIVVLTLKGADLDLTVLVDPIDYVKKDSVKVTMKYADSLKAYIDSLTARGLTVSLELNKPTDFSKLDVAIFTFKPTPIDPTPPIPDPKPPVVDPEPNKDKPIELKIVQPTQFTNNSINNNNSEPLQIFADNSLIQTIPANGSGSYQLKGQSTIKFVCGNSSRSVETSLLSSC